jgi:hypothetical protein
MPAAKDETVSQQPEQLALMAVEERQKQKRLARIPD